MFDKRVDVSWTGRHSGEQNSTKGATQIWCISSSEYLTQTLSIISLDDTALADLKQELERSGERHHRSPSRSLSVPNRPRPLQPPQRPPPPGEFHFLNWVFSPTQQLFMCHCWVTKKVKLFWNVRLWIHSLPSLSLTMAAASNGGKSVLRTTDAPQRKAPCFSEDGVTLLTHHSIKIVPVFIPDDLKSYVFLQFFVCFWLNCSLLLKSFNKTSCSAQYLSFSAWQAILACCCVQWGTRRMELFTKTLRTWGAISAVQLLFLWMLLDEWWLLDQHNHVGLLRNTSYAPLFFHPQSLSSLHIFQS